MAHARSTGACAVAFDEKHRSQETSNCAPASWIGSPRLAEPVAMNTVASELQERVGRPIFSSFHACFSFGGTPHRLVNEDTGEASSRWQRFIVFPSNCRRRADVAERANEEARTAAFV
jgi:hypothetical protein